MDSPQTQRAATVVVGIGNILLRDEGIGVHIVNWMKEQGGYPDVEFIDAGTFGDGLADVMSDRRRLIVVDAGDIEGSPARIARLTMDDLFMQAGGISLHEYGLAETLFEAKILGGLPAEIVIIAIKPADITPGIGLTPQLQAAVPAILAAVQQELKR
jgi:hydrogenase maturation protease